MGLNVKHKIIKLLEENRKKSSGSRARLGKEFLDWSPKVQPIKGKIDKLDLIKIKDVYSVKDSVKWMKR